MAEATKPREATASRPHSTKRCISYSLLQGLLSGRLRATTSPSSPTSPSTGKSEMAREKVRTAAPGRKARSARQARRTAGAQRRPSPDRDRGKASGGKVLHTRRPTEKLRNEGVPEARPAERTASPGVPNVAPRWERNRESSTAVVSSTSRKGLADVLRGYAWLSSPHQVPTFPSASDSPKSLGRFCPTGHAWYALL